MFSTLWSVLFDAPKAFRRMIRDAGLGGPILYFLILGTIFGWVGMMWEAMFSAALEWTRPRSTSFQSLSFPNSNTFL